MRAAASYPIDELVPHKGPMCLLDRVIDAGDEHLVAEVTIRADGLFADGGAVGAWVGIEYMAQAVAAWAGWRARAQGGVPKIGLLLGTRDYRCAVARFQPGQCLTVSIRREFVADNGLGQFQCSIRDGDIELASVALNVFEPDDLVSILKREVSR